MLLKVSINSGIFIVLELNGIHLDDIQPAVPPAPSVIDYSHEASEYEKKLIQVSNQMAQLTMHYITYNLHLFQCVCTIYLFPVLVCVCACVRACVRECVHACVHACEMCQTYTVYFCYYV